MGGGRRRVARRACLAAAAVCGVLAIALPARAQDDAVGPVPDVFRGAASAFVASVEVDRDALLPVDELFRFIALDATSVYETDLQTARGSLLFPGNGLILGPNLACSTFGAQFPPEFGPLLDACLAYEYPLSVTANASQPTDATEGSLSLGAPTDPVSATATGARASAGPDGSSSRAALESLRVLGLPAFGGFSLIPGEELDLDPSILTIDTATSRTDQRIVQGVLTVDAEAVLEGVSLVGGLIRIGAVHSRSRVTDDAAGTRTAEASLDLSGVTVAGVPASITDDGLVLGSPSDSSGPLHEQLQSVLTELLSALQIRLTVLDSEETTDDGTGQAVASAGGILLEVAADVQSLPTVPGPIGDLDPNGTYVGSILLGNTAAAAGADTFEPFEPAPIDEPDLGAGGVDLGTPVPGAPSAASGEVTAPAEGGGGDESAAPSPQLTRVFTDPFGGRLGLVYLSFCFAVLALALTPRLGTPARLAAPLT